MKIISLATRIIQSFSIFPSLGKDNGFKYHKSSYHDGLNTDKEKLTKDWKNVFSDLEKSFNKLVNV